MLKKFCDTLIERSVVPSFSGLGYSARRRLFAWRELSSYDLAGQTIVLTGGTSGIGEAAAEQYALLGAQLVIVARDKQKAEATAQALTRKTGNTQIDVVIADLGERDSAQAAAHTLLERYPRIDTLIHNAGALFNTRKRASNDHDLTVELMVITPFLFTCLLLPALTARTASGGRPGRVITMSSGGMYTENLRVDDLAMSDESYHGAKQYARAKRAQVSLNHSWAEQISAESCVFHAVHPGWVNTPGIQGALPAFTRWLARVRLLRTPLQGADTLIWLTADDEVLESSGDFWHDRERRDVHMMRRTRESDTPEARQALWDWCVETTDCAPDAQPPHHTAA